MEEILDCKKQLKITRKESYSVIKAQKTEIKRYKQEIKNCIKCDDLTKEIKEIITHSKSVLIQHRSRIIAKEIILHKYAEEMVGIADTIAKKWLKEIKE